MTTPNDIVDDTLLMTHCAMAYGFIEIHVRYDRDHPTRFYYRVADQNLISMLTLHLLISFDQHFFGPIYLKLFDQSATITSPSFKNARWMA